LFLKDQYLPVKNKFQILYFILLISASAAGQTADSTILTVLKRVKLAGFTQVRFQHTLNSKQDGVDIPRARLDLKYATSQKWEYHLQVDFGGSSVKLLDATIGHTFSREFSLLTGQFKIPFSLENVASDANLDFINRAQVVEAMVARSRDITGNQNGRDIGLQISGSIIRMNDTSLVDYYAAVVNGQGINIADANLYKDFAGRIVLHPLKRLSVGGSVYSGYDRIFFFGPNVVRNRFGGEISWSWKDLVLQGEYIHGKDGMVIIY